MRAELARVLVPTRLHQDRVAGAGLAFNAGDCAGAALLGSRGKRREIGFGQMKGSGSNSSTGSKTR